jgi:hypothetical protein
MALCVKQKVPTTYAVPGLGYSGREIADYPGVDEFYPFLLKAALG